MTQFVITFSALAAWPTLTATAEERAKGLAPKKLSVTLLPEEIYSSRIRIFRNQTPAPR